MHYWVKLLMLSIIESNQEAQTDLIRRFSFQYGRVCMVDTHSNLINKPERDNTDTYQPLNGKGRDKLFWLRLVVK